MKVCKQCGQSVQDVETYCPRCGSGQLVADGASKPQQRPHQQRVVQEQNIQARQPQQAPPGYRNPNSVNQQRPMQRPPQQTQSNQQRQIQKPPQQTQSNQQRQIQKPPQQTVQQDEFGFNTAQQVENTPKKKTLFSKKEKKQASAQPEASQVYEQDMQQENTDIGYSQTAEVVSMKEWAIMWLKLLIPIYNIIFVIGAWQGKNVSVSMRNFIRVYVIILAASMLLSILISVVLGGMITNIITNMMY